MTDAEISQTQSRAARTARKQEVQDGRWRNPALSDKARKKLSRPRQHKGALAAAIEKVRQVGMASLSAKERSAYLAYRKGLRAKRRDEIRQYYRERYKAQQAALTPEEREAQRAKWREQNHKRRNG